MKHALLVCLILVSCGKENAAPISLTGTWKGTSGSVTDSRVFGADGSYEERYTSSGHPDIVWRGTYATSGGTLTKTITSSEGLNYAGQCASVSFNLSTSALSIVCDGQTETLNHQ